MCFSELIPPLIPPNRESVKQFVRADYNLRDSATVEFYHEKKYINLNNVSGIVKDDKQLRFWETSRDLTQQDAAEDKLREVELRYRTVADFTYDWETWENPDGSFNYGSPSFERIMGYLTKQLINRPGFFSGLPICWRYSLHASADRHRASGNHPGLPG
jgi:PAS domain-containing protein